MYRNMSGFPMGFLRSVEAPLIPFTAMNSFQVFHGWAEKLEIFTGRSWDLPCNCGLDLCLQFHRTSDYPQLGDFQRHLVREQPPNMFYFGLGKGGRDVIMIDYDPKTSDWWFRMCVAFPSLSVDDESEIQMVWKQKLASELGL